MQTDLTFFTNEPNVKLVDRFKNTLKGVQYFDVLVGYFRTSGFHLLYESFEKIDKIRILVGLDADRKTLEILEESRLAPELPLEGHSKTRQIISKQVEIELEDAEDKYDIEQGVRKFIEYLLADCPNKEEDISKGGNGKKLEVKAYPSKDLHAKVYISRFHKDDRDFGRVITGSSNFSEKGLQGNLEFNVELKQRADVEYALEKFNSLWADSVDISQQYIETIRTNTWVNDNIPPYELYLKMLYEYFKEDINIDQESEAELLPDGFMRLEYQQQAVISARKILEAYNGVFLADVVGLGKTFISALLAQQLPGRKLFICPPVLKEYWEETLAEFRVTQFKVESLGKLDILLKQGVDKYSYVFIDEAHRFRNEFTQGFEKLHNICLGKKVVLISATPINNRFDDLFSQIRLFQPAKKSTIPGVTNLEKFFKRIATEVEQYDKSSPEYLEEMKQASKKIRDKVLRHVMVRRTRSEIRNYFENDLKVQGLSFPGIADPQQLIYTFDEEMNKVFNQTIELLTHFQYARYRPLTHLKVPPSDAAFQYGREMAIGGFMKGIIVKRLESSVYAFKRTIKRFIDSYEAFIEMFEDGKILISKKVNVYDLLDEDNDEEINRLIAQGDLKKYDKKDFKDDYIDFLRADLKTLRKIRDYWAGIQEEEDPKLQSFINELKANTQLKGKKLIVFTESKETGQYLFQHLNQKFPRKVMFFSSLGGDYDSERHTRMVARDMIKENFDPNNKTKEDYIRILITTDVLAEGINLHRSNILVNYDLPWNPTRVLQRVGRVNRVGTAHDNVYIYNFFPTDESEKHLGLKASIVAKIQAFHNTLGEDAKYLSEAEEVSTHELFGNNLYQKLITKSTYEGEEEDQQSEWEYLKVLRDIRDNDDELFRRINKLPKKARSSKKGYTQEHALITFFRKGKLKKFYLYDGHLPIELTFFDAAALMRCDKKTKQVTIPREYYEMLAKNKEAFRLATSEEEQESEISKRSNEAQVTGRLKTAEFRDNEKFTDDDEEYIRKVIEAYRYGLIPKNTTRRINQAISREINPTKVLAILRQNITELMLTQGAGGDVKGLERREVILSEYLTQ
jgi:superfamily II DNA/RNA helicase/HKD family nuclease